MITYKRWVHKIGQLGTRDITREGWFLFGFIPLYTRDLGVRQ